MTEEEEDRLYMIAAEAYLVRQRETNNDFPECMRAAVRALAARLPNGGQLERVALAIEAKMFAPHELPVPADIHAKYPETAKAALAAARLPDREGWQDEADRLRKGIQDYLDGNYDSPRKLRELGANAVCTHGRRYYEDCGECIDRHFSLLLGETIHATDEQEVKP